MVTATVQLFPVSRMSSLMTRLSVKLATSDSGCPRRYKNDPAKFLRREKS